MAEITVPGDISGRPYRFIISGDSPTVTEQQRIDAILRQQEHEFVQAYQERFGEQLSDEGEGILNYLGEIPKGLLSGAAGMLESAALGAATLLPEGVEDPARELIRGAGYAAQRRLLPDIGLEESIGRRLSEGVGSFGALIGTGAISPWLAAGTAVGAGAGEASERARAADATPEERATAAALGGVVGASELIPLSLLRVLGRTGAQGVTAFIARAAAEGGVEGAQEAAAQVAQNLIEQGIYNPERGTLDGAGESFAIGGGTGAIVQGLFDLALPRSRGTRTQTEDTPTALDRTPADVDQAEMDLRGGATAEVQTRLGVVPPASPTQLELPLFPERQEQQLELPLEAPVGAQGDLFNVGPTIPTPPSAPAGVGQAEMDLRGGTAATVQPSLATVPPASPAQLELPLFPARQEQQLEMPLEAPVGTQGDLFNVGPTAPAPTPAPQMRISTTTLDNLGVSKQSKAYRRIAGGDVASAEALALLAEYAKNPAVRSRRPDVARRVGDFTANQLALLPKPAATAAGLAAAEDTGRSGPPAAGVSAERPARRTRQRVQPAPVEPAGPVESAAPERVGVPDGGVGDVAAAEGRVAPAVDVTETPEIGRGPSSPTLPAPAAPEAAVSGAPTPRAPTPREWSRDAAPGAEMGVPLRVPQPGIRPEPGRTPEPKLTAEERIAQARTAQAQEVAATRQQAQARWAAVQDQVQRLVGTTIKVREYRRANPVAAAHSYFSKDVSIPEALENIAYDYAVAQVRHNPDADGNVGARGVYSKDVDEAVADPLYANTGGQWAVSAYRWVQENLPADTVADVDRMVAEAAKDARMTDEQLNEAAAAAIAEAARRDVHQKELVESMAAIATVGTRLHPNIVRALRAGNISEALRGLSITHFDQRVRELASKLGRFAENVSSVRVVPAAEMQQLARDADANPNAVALFFPADGSIAISEDAMTADVLLHEMVHVATEQVMMNESHPLTKQVDRLLTLARQALPNDTYGLTDRFEFMSEAMTNPRFAGMLAQINVDGTRITMLQRLRHTLRNFLRRLMGYGTRSIDSARTRTDALFDAITAVDLDHVDAGDMLSGSFQAPTARAALMNGAATRIREMTGADMAKMNDLIGNAAVPSRARRLIFQAGVPLRNLVDMAKRAFPDAAPIFERVFQTIEGHGAAIDASRHRVQESIAKIVAPLKKDPKLIDTLNTVASQSTLHQVDPRRPRTFYADFQLYYDVLDADGLFVRREYKQYPTLEARQEAFKRMSKNVPANRTAPKRLDPDPDKLEIWDKLQPLWSSLGKEGQTAYSDIINLFEYFHKETARVLRARLRLMEGDGPGQLSKSASNRVYRTIYNKVLAENILNPYIPLVRHGRFWLAYTAKDPFTGNTELYKHAFETEQDRLRAIAELDRLRTAEGMDISKIEPYDGDTPRAARPPVPLGFAADVLKIAEEGKVDSAVMQQLQDLVFDAAPEKSFVQAFRKRAGTRGFKGDISPLTGPAAESSHDMVNLLQQKGFTMGRQLADMEYSARMDRAMADMKAYRAAQVTRSDIPAAQAARRNTKLADYADTFQQYGTAMRTHNSAWSRNTTALGYMLTLGFNVSTAALTFFQMPTIIMPYLTGAYGIGNTNRALGNAVRVLAGSGTSRGVESIGAEGKVETTRRDVRRWDASLSNYDLSDPKNAKLRRYLELQEEMRRRGVFNRSIAEDMLGFSDAGGMFNRFVSMSGYMQHHAERYTRETTAIATYDLELQKIANREGVVGIDNVSEAGRREAADKAVYTSELTNGTILATGAPLLAQTNIGKVVYLFKRFGLHMYHLLFNTMARSFAKPTGNPKSAEYQAALFDRRAARLQTAGILGSVALFAGVQGMPFFSLVGQLFDLLFTDDDEEDFETLVRRSTGELGFNGIVDYLTGASVAERIGLSGMFFRPSYRSDDLPTLWAFAEGIGGPVVGLANRYLDTVPRRFSEGDIYRGIEAAMPSALANPLRSYRYATEGITTLRGDPIVGDVGVGSAVAQFFGFMPVEYRQQLDMNALGERIDSAIQSERTRLLRQLYVARRFGDVSGYRDTMDGIREFNRRNPQYPILPETILDSANSHLRTTSRMHHGVLFSSRNDAMIRQLLDWDAPSVWSQ